MKINNLVHAILLYLIVFLTFSHSACARNPDSPVVIESDIITTHVNEDGSATEIEDVIEIMQSPSFIESASKIRGYP